MVKHSLALISKYNTDPFNYFPDIYLFLNVNHVKVGVVTLRAQDVIWSSKEFESGIRCSKIIYSDIKVLYYALF